MTFQYRTQNNVFFTLTDEGEYVFNQKREMAKIWGVERDAFGTVVNYTETISEEEKQTIDFLLFDPKLIRCVADQSLTGIAKLNGTFQNILNNEGIDYYFNGNLYIGFVDEQDHW